MDKSGDADDCISTPEAADLAAKLSEEELKNLPLPGQVDFINGGPPCQVCEVLPSQKSVEVTCIDSHGMYLLQIAGILWNE